MINSRKKGFTLVELVIVIAVIAILAAVLIPTFSSLVKKANIASDTAVARNLNTAAISADAKTFDDALTAVRDAGYLVANLNAKAEDCYFVWEDDSDQFLLYDLKEQKIIYSNSAVSESPDDSWCFAVSNASVANEVKTALPNITIKNTATSISDVESLITAGGEVTIYVDESIIMDESNVIVVDNPTASVTIDLGNNSVAGNNSGTPTENNIPFFVEQGELTIKGGVIKSTGNWYDSDNELVSSAIKADKGTLNVDSTEFNCPGGQILIAYAGANGTVSNSKINTKSSAINVGGDSDVVVENCEINVENEAIWVSNSGCTKTKVTVKGGKYNGIGNTIAMYGGTLVIEDGEFTAKQANLFRFYYTGSSITIKGGTFTANGVTYKFNDLTDSIIKGMFSTGSMNYAGITVTKNADGSITVAN